MNEFILTLLGAALVNNLILGLPLGADVLRQPRSQAQALASAAMLVPAVPLAWVLDRLLLAPLELEALRLFLFLPLLAPLAWLILRLLAQLLPNLPRGELWPLLLGNGAVLGTMLMTGAGSFWQALGLGIGGGLGLWLALTLFDDLLKQVEQADVPAPFKGTPMLLICAGLMGLAFLGFNGFGAP